MARPYMNVTVWEHTPENGVKMLALIVLHKSQNITAIIPNSNGRAVDLTVAQFEEWHAFALFCGHEIDYVICSEDYVERSRYRVKSRAMQAIAS